MLHVEINGNNYSCEEGKTLLNLFHEIGIHVPSLCFDPRLQPESSCRACLVKIEGKEHLQPSCSTYVSDGMKVVTHSKEIEEYRKTVLAMLAKDYPFEEVAKNPDKEFHQWLHHYDITKNSCDQEHAININVDTSHPFIQVDMSRCIRCTRCVRICNELQGQFVWHVIERGEQTHIIANSQNSFAKSSCVSCGACADACPTGAIEDKHSIKYGTAEKNIKSVCAYCGVGCEINVGVKDEKIVGIHPVYDSPVNKGHLCVKGRYAWEYVYAADRITEPMIKENGEWKKVSWKDALQFAAKKLTAIKMKYGADGVALLGSARATNEENYLIQKFARTVIGTNNIDNCARVCHQPTAKAMTIMLGTGAATNSYDDIEQAKTFLVVGSNATENHPVVGARIKQMVLKGANLIIIDPRKTELASLAKYHLQLKPGTNIPLLNAMANAMLTESLVDVDFIEERIDNWNDFKNFITYWTPEKAAKVCHVHPQLIRDAAKLYAKAKPAMCFHGLGVTEHVQGTEGVMALVNLALITGNIGKPGTGINPLRGQNNVQGSAAMGCDPAVYTGMALIKTEKNRFEDLWQTPLPSNKGLNLLEMMDAAAAGNLKAMWIMGYDTFFSLPDANAKQKSFESLEFVIVQDMFMNETAKRFANVFFPVASSFEKEGTFMNSERRIQKLRRVISSPQNAKPDWEIVCDMAKTMNHQNLFNYSTAEEIWNEIRQTWKAVYGITYERIEDAGIQWPCASLTDKGTTILHTKNFPAGKVKLAKIKFAPSPEKTSKQYPFTLITGRRLYHFNAGTMTYRTPVKEIEETDLLYMHPNDAQRLKLSDGEEINIISKYGSAILPVHIHTSSKQGEVFTTFSNKNVFINKITAPFRDNYVETPEYKITAVRIEKIDK